MTIPHDLPGNPPAEDDAVDLATRLIDLLNRYPGDAQGRRQLEEIRRAINGHMAPEDSLPEWSPVESWPNAGPGWLPTSWIIPEVLPAARLTLFSGEGGAGKTRVAMQIAASLAAGLTGPFLQKEKIEPFPQFAGALDKDNCINSDWHGGKVVWASWETAKGDFQVRLEAAAAITPLEELSEKLFYNNMRPHGALWGPEKARHISTTATLLEGGRRLLDYAETIGAKILVLDPLAAAYAGNENDRSLVRPFLSFLADWADRTGCAVLIISHPPKTGDDGYSGSTDWHNGVQARWVIQPCKCKEDEDGVDCPVQLLRVAKLSEGRVLERSLAFEWDDTQRTLALVNHFQQLGKKKRKGMGKRSGSSHNGTNDHSGTVPMGISVNGETAVQERDFDLR